jgi:hypothetical protein
MIYGFTLGSAGSSSNPIWLDGFMISIFVTEYLNNPWDIGPVVEGLHKLEQPAILLLPAAAGVGVGLFHYSLIVPVVAAGCLEPTPAEPVTCLASLGAAADLAVVGTGSIYGSYQYMKHVGVPGLKDWWHGR